MNRQTLLRGKPVSPGLPSLLLGVLSVMGSAGSLAAQPIGESAERSSGYARSGFWLRLGFGAVGLDLTCDGCQIDRDWGAGGFFGIGGTVTPSVQLGIGSNSWTDTDDFDVSASLLSAQVILFKDSESNVFLQLGGGLAVVAEFGGDFEAGPGVLGGVGVDLPVSNGLAITAYGSFVYGWFRQLDLNMNLIQLGLGIGVP